MGCSPAEHVLCDFVSAVSAGDLVGNVFAHFRDPGDRAAVQRALDALALLDPGQSAGDDGRWHVALLRLGVTCVPPPGWWPSGEGGILAHREFILGGRVQRVAVRVGPVVGS
ncbi:MAG: hypothetical protein ACXU8N_12210 [Telluria sp.]